MTSNQILWPNKTCFFFIVLIKIRKQDDRIPTDPGVVDRTSNFLKEESQMRSTRVTLRIKNLPEGEKSREDRWLPMQNFQNCTAAHT